jgi:plasmid stabilization system protein ParE
MKSTVIWKPQADEQLTTIWTEAEDRRAVTAAANEIDRQLKINADSFGEARSGITRLAVVPPLAVQVDVLTIHFVPRRSTDG